MRQIIFEIPLFGWYVPIYGYGLMLVAAFLAASQLAKYLARRCGLDGELFINAAMLALIAGLVGSRLSHIIENLPEFTRADRTAWQNLLEMVNVSSGGLTYYGGFILAFPTLVFYAWRRKIPLRLGMDIVAPCLMVGLAIGRIGCFLNGCCYGPECNLPWQVRFAYGSPAYVEQFQHRRLTPRDPRLVKTVAGQLALLDRHELRRSPELAALAAAERSLPLHPAQLYTTVTATLIAAVLLAFFTVRKIPGQVFALMMVLEGFARFILELLRTEPPVLGPMSLSMVIGLCLAGAGIAMWIGLARLGVAPSPPAIDSPRAWRTTRA